MSLLILGVTLGIETALFILASTHTIGPRQYTKQIPN